jgi:hypothetical protein
MLERARDGYGFFRVSTPQCFREYELSLRGELNCAELACYEELQDLAEIHRTSVLVGDYRTG